MKIRLSGPMQPERVLYEFDGPLVFTVRDDDGDLLLAYQAGEDDEDGTRKYLLVPFDAERITDLTEGRMPLLEALSQPWMWLASGGVGAFDAIRACSLADLPDGLSLPEPSVMLWPSLEPVVTFRMIGPHIVKGAIPGSVVAKGISAPSGAIKGIVSYIKKQLAGVKYDLEWLVDIKVQRIVYSSFDVGLKLEAPALSPQQNPVPEIKRLLSAALTAASSADPGKALTSYFGSEQEGKAILKAITELTPPDRGLIASTQVGGRLVQGGRAIALSRKSRKYINERLAKPKQDSGGPITQLTGLIRAHDLDQGMFILREIEERDGEMVCRYLIDREHEITGLVDKSARVRISVQERKDGVSILIGPVEDLPDKPR